jgi:5-methylcytosine-specific restriction endonuclease McrA
MIAAELAKRRGIQVKDKEAMVALIMDVAERHGNLDTRQTKEQRRTARSNLENHWKKSPPKPKRKASPTNDRFYLCKEWRELRYLALRNTDGRCQCCGGSAKDGIRIHVDHIKPRAMFPELQLDLNNLQVLCDDCNIGKGHWDITDWRNK